MIRLLVIACMWFGYCDEPPVDLSIYLDRIDRSTVSLIDPPPPPKPTAPKSPPPVYQGIGTNVEQWRGLVEAYFPASEVERALCVMAGESGGNPWAKNPSSSAAGLFQFLKSTWDNMVPIEISGGSYNAGLVYDPARNVAAAAWLQGAIGWSQWSWYNRGHCH